MNTPPLCYFRVFNLSGSLRHRDATVEPAGLQHMHGRGQGLSLSSCSFSTSTARGSSPQCIRQAVPKFLAAIVQGGLEARVLMDPATHGLPRDLDDGGDSGEVWPLASKSTAAACWGSNSSRAWRERRDSSGYVGPYGRSPVKRMFPYPQTREKYSRQALRSHRPQGAAMALYLRPHASQAPAAPQELVERRFHGQVPRKRHRGTIRVTCE